MSEILIRNEKESDHKIVEYITREAFWNLHGLGCDEHYLVHLMRDHEDFVPKLNYVMEVNGQISILPEYQRQGYSKKLLEYSFEKAVDMGFEVIVIFGNPNNYLGRGFLSCKKYNVCIEEDIYPTAMLVKELKSGSLEGKKWVYSESEVYHIDEEKALKFDEQFEPKEKLYRPSHEEFYILSHSQVLD